MEEKKLTDEEIAKVLDECFAKVGEMSCEGCKVYTGEGLRGCMRNVGRQSLDLIHRLQNDYSNLKERYVKVLDLNEKVIAEQKAEIERLKEELENLNWYKMWHNKFKKKIEDLTLELETYRPTKLSGNGQCKCSNCGAVSWTDWFSRYKGQTLCNKCLKEIVETEEKQAVNDTAKEICLKIIKDQPKPIQEKWVEWFKKEYDVEVE